MSLYRIFSKFEMFLLILIMFLLIVYPSFASRPKPLKNLTWDIIKKIGKQQGDDPDVFFEITDIEVDSKGNFYALDKGRFAIQCFDSTGHFLKTISLSKGQGPGEVLFPSKLAITPFDELALLDSQLRRVYFYSQSNEKKYRTMKLPDSFPVAAAVDFKIDDSGNVWITHNDLKNHNALHIYSQEGKLVKSFLKIDPLNLGVNMPLFFTGYFDWYQKNIIFVKETPYAVSIFDENGGQIINFEVEKSMSRPPEIIKRGAGFILPGFNRATFVANLEDNYVITQYYFAKEKISRFDLYDIKTGRLIAKRTVSDDIALALLAAKNGKLYATRTTDELVEILIVKVEIY